MLERRAWRSRKKKWGSRFSPKLSVDWWNTWITRMAVEWKRIVRYSFWSKIIFHFSSPKRKTHWFDKEKNSELSRKWRLFWLNSQNNYLVSKSKWFVFLNETLTVDHVFTDSEKTFSFEMLPLEQKKTQTHKSDFEYVLLVYSIISLNVKMK